MQSCAKMAVQKLRRWEPSCLREVASFPLCVPLWCKFSHQIQAYESWMAKSEPLDYGYNLIELST